MKQLFSEAGQQAKRDVCPVGRNTKELSLRGARCFWPEALSRTRVRMKNPNKTQQSLGREFNTEILIPGSQFARLGFPGLNTKSKT